MTKFKNKPFSFIGNNLQLEHNFFSYGNNIKHHETTKPTVAKLIIAFKEVKCTRSNNDTTPQQELVYFGDKA